MKIVGASTWIVQFLAIVIWAGGAVCACTSADNGPAIGDAGPDESPRGTPEAAADAGSDRTDGEAGPACVASPVGVATIDASALFGCYQTVCAAELGECAADCVCNAAIMTGLQCLLAGSGTSESCFYAPILRNGANMAVRSAGTCLQVVLDDGGCERGTGGQPEGGSDAAAQMAPDAAGEGGADPAGEGGADAAGEGGGKVGNDSGESDAPAGG